MCGGRSGEHEVSLQSANSVISAINKEKYNIIIIGIAKNGSWHLLEEGNFLLNANDPAKIALKPGGKDISINPTPNVNNFHTEDGEIEIDVVFPVLHGTYGEDGTLQGLLDMLGLPYVGANYLASAAAMDKDVAKRLFIQAGLRTADYLTFDKELNSDDIDCIIGQIENKFSYPLFVKPANLGSSVGISKAHNRGELLKSIDDAWLYDTKILVEETINGREIECSVLGNAHVEASELGEIIPKHEFYSYEAKYLDPDGANLIVGAKVPTATKSRVQEMAIKAFRALCCEGMGRVDFLLEKDTGEIFINEINTIPGFTKISMYPKLLEASGIGYAELIDRLIQLALKRDELKQSLKTDYNT